MLGPTHLRSLAPPPPNLQLAFTKSLLFSGAEPSQLQNSGADSTWISGL